MDCFFFKKSLRNLWAAAEVFVTLLMQMYYVCGFLFGWFIALLIQINMDRSFKFCILLTLGVVIPFVFVMVPLYIRHQLYATYQLPVSSTDSRLLNYRASTFWCESEKIEMNSTFNAYLMHEKPVFENTTRTYWTTKEFHLLDEEREYWGFYLPKNTFITISACTRYPGSVLAVYKGKRNMKKCSNREDDDDEDEKESSEGDDHLTDNDEFGMETDDENSSISSSEEQFLEECHGALFNHTLVPIKHCDNTSNWQATDIINYNVTSSDYYYFLFSSYHNMKRNTIISKFTLRKSVFDVTRALQVCNNVTNCSLPLAFGSTEHVVLEMPNVTDWVVDAGNITCEPRTIVYFPFYLGVPISILCFAFRGMR
ncbi:hypothetical protein CHUAL_001213 [Chamberlinius hualienensis]